MVDNIESGFDLHRLDTGHWKRNFPVGKPTRKLPKQVAFGERSKVVVGGSDHGAVYVFDRKTAFPLHVLGHGDGLVQTLTVSGLRRIRASHPDIYLDARQRQCKHDCQRIVKQLWRGVDLCVGQKVPEYDNHRK